MKLSGRLRGTEGVEKKGHMTGCRVGKGRGKLLILF